MTDLWAGRVAAEFGTLGSVAGLGASCWSVSAGSRQLVVKVGAGVADEAAGLSSIAATGAMAVPEVLLAEDDFLVTSYVSQGSRTASHESALGEGLARLRAAPWAQFGGGSSFVGGCQVDPVPAPDAATFYSRRLAGLARHCGLEPVVQPVLDRLDELIPAGPPSLLHGDLWWGNVLFGEGGRPWLIDPSCHGGHPEEDLAMLALFGRVPYQLLGSYQEVRPFDAGWESRRELFQLYPLLVHAVLFGSPYHARAESVARSYG